MISGSAKSDEAEEIASVISGSAKSDEAEEIASVISGSAKSDEAEEEGLAYLVIEEFALDEESKTSPPDPSRLEAYRTHNGSLGCLTTGRKPCKTPNLLSRASYLISKMRVSAIPVNQMKSWWPCPRRTYTRSISSRFVL